ncbi:lipase family protein [Azospirillum sp. ST 5-10]|uniref:lipase family protein n=1 Tax=unclassified Azospirillum TaxID=2630922 RepID=UPI003F4A0430
MPWAGGERRSRHDRPGRCRLAAAFALLAALAAPAAVSAPPRGGLLAMAEVARFTAAQIDAAVGDEMALVGPAACDVGVFDLRYATVGVHGEPADASAVLLLPSGSPACAGDVPLLGWARGTETRRTAAQADRAAEVANSPLAAFYAAKGYAVAATDYLGLGRSGYPFHPYLHAGSEATAIVDALRAARQAARLVKADLSGQVMLAGYSQGGHATLAAQRAIERDHADEFDLVASAPMAGPYYPSRIVLDGWSGGGSAADPLAPLLLSYTLVSYERAYGGLYRRPGEVFRPPFAERVEALFPGPWGVFELAENAPFAGVADLDAVRTPAFARAVERRPDHPFRAALRRNDLLDGWTPRTPTLLCGARRDAVVPFASTLEAARAFAGAPVTVVDVDPQIPAGVDGVEAHAGWGAYLCYAAARQRLFDGVRRRGHQIGTEAR